MWLIGASRRVCKRAFFSTLGTRNLTPGVLDTTFCLVEPSLNARPLSPINIDPDSLEAIATNHFLNVLQFLPEAFRKSSTVENES